MGWRLLPEICGGLVFDSWDFGGFCRGPGSFGFMSFASF